MKLELRQRRDSLIKSNTSQVAFLILFSLATTWFAGCSHRGATRLAPIESAPCQDVLQQIEYPDLMPDPCDDEPIPYSGTPVTISNYQEQIPLDMTLEQCVELTLANSKVLQKLGGVVVNSPAVASTLFDQAIVETGQGSVEAALSAFDAQSNNSFFYNRSERKFNNPLAGGGADALISNTSNSRFELSKQTAAGTSFAGRTLIDYNRTNIPIATPGNPFGNRFGSTYDWVSQLEFRQPLLQGRGTAVNRIAGPNALPGQYNGVLIARIRSDISLSDFEASVRDLIRDVENNYWELYFAYRDLDTKMTARDSARKIWENRKLRFENGVGRPDEEAQARQQYFSFQLQAQNALTGILGGQLGVLGAERNLRRLMSFPGSDGRLIRPISEPAIAPVVFDWEAAQQQALDRRVEIRRQKWTVKQRELELLAAKALNKWRFDFVGQYGFRGFGDDLFGNGNSEDGSAFRGLINGDLDDWQLGVELGGAIGNRVGHLAIRNAELNLVRERALLKEQQRQIILDLNAAYTQVDSSLQAIRASFNSRVAAQEEFEAKLKRVVEGQDQVFFLLDVEQRAAASESAVHRSISDYNLALLNYAYATGSLLSRFNVSLAEGPWSDAAEQNATCKAYRFTQDGKACQDTCPVSAGPYNQVTYPTSRQQTDGDIVSERQIEGELQREKVIEEESEGQLEDSEPPKPELIPDTTSRETSKGPFAKAKALFGGWK